MSWHGLTILEALAEKTLFTKELAEKIGTSPDSICGCLRTLRGKGFIQSVTADGVGIHQITDSGRAALEAGVPFTSGPCSGNAQSRAKTTLRDSAWWELREEEFVTLDDLLGLYCNGDEKAAADNLRSFLTALHTAGFLTLNTRGGLKRYRLRANMNTGPKTPAWNRKTGLVRDINTGKLYPGRPGKQRHVA